MGGAFVGGFGGGVQGKLRKGPSGRVTFETFARDPKWGGLIEWLDRDNQLMGGRRDKRT